MICIECGKQSKTLDDYSQCYKCYCKDNNLVYFDKTTLNKPVNMPNLVDEAELGFGSAYTILITSMLYIAVMFVPWVKSKIFNFSNVILSKLPSFIAENNKIQDFSGYLLLIALAVGGLLIYNIMSNLVNGLLKEKKTASKGVYIISVFISVVLLVIFGFVIIVNNMTERDLIITVAAVPLIIGLNYLSPWILTNKSSNLKVQKYFACNEKVDGVVLYKNIEETNIAGIQIPDEIPEKIFIIDYKNKIVRYITEIPMIKLTKEERYIKDKAILEKLSINSEFVDIADELNEFQNEYNIFKRLCEKEGINTELTFDVRNYMNRFSQLISTVCDDSWNYSSMKKSITDCIKRLVEDYESVELEVSKEQEIDKSLSLYENNIVILKDVRLLIETEVIECNRLLITNRGLFIVKIEDIGVNGDYNILIEKDGMWIKKYIDGRIENFEDNPTEQNNKHVAHLTKYINVKMNRNIDNSIDVRGIIVLANDVVKIKNESLQKVVRPLEIYNVINSYNKVLVEQEMLEIKDIVISNKLRREITDVEDFEDTCLKNIESFNEICKDIINGTKDFRENIEKYKISIENM